MLRCNLQTTPERNEATPGPRGASRLVRNGGSPSEVEPLVIGLVLLAFDADDREAAS